MIDLTNNLWAVTVGGTLIATVAGGYLLNSFSKRKEDRELEAHLRSRLNYAHELRNSGSQHEALGVCEDLLTEVSEVKHPALYDQVKLLAGNLRTEIRQAGSQAVQNSSVSPADQTGVFSQTAALPASVPPASISQNSSSTSASNQQLPSLARLKEDLEGMIPSVRVNLGLRKNRRKRKKTPLELAIIGVFVLLLEAFNGVGVRDVLITSLVFIFIIALQIVKNKSRAEGESEEDFDAAKVPAALPGLSPESHPMLLQINDLLNSLEQELKQVPKDLASSFKGIQNDLQTLREKANKLNEVWKNVAKLLSQMIPLQEGEIQTSLPASVLEQETKTKKNLEDLKSHIQAQMAETLAMLRALIAQVIQLKASPRLTEPDSFSQIRDNLSQRLNQLEAVEDTFHPFESWRQKG